MTLILMPLLLQSGPFFSERNNSVPMFGESHPQMEDGSEDTILDTMKELMARLEEVEDFKA